MSNIWTYDTLRVITFILLFISFFIMMRRGALKLFIDRKNFYWDRFMNLVWCTVICISIGDVLHQNIPGSWRVWFVFGAAVLQLFIVIWRSPYYQTGKSSDSV